MLEASRRVGVSKTSAIALWAESRGTTSLNCSCTLRWIAKPHEPVVAVPHPSSRHGVVARLGLHARRVHEDSQAMRQRSSQGR